uniref:putative caspase-16 n=1 Tax=Halichoerus grypus TaxID=9711 RepID=UPI0016594A65|nr:putative caspase-16 [Halichoerus grypus]
MPLGAPSGQLRQPQQLVQELSRCRALWGCPKVFLLLSVLGLLQDSQRVRGHLLPSPPELLVGYAVPGGCGTLGAPARTQPQRSV